MSRHVAETAFWEKPASSCIAGGRVEPGAHCFKFEPWTRIATSANLLQRWSPVSCRPLTADRQNLMGVVSSSCNIASNLSIERERGRFCFDLPDGCIVIQGRIYAAFLPGLAAVDNVIVVCSTLLRLSCIQVNQGGVRGHGGHGGKIHALAQSGAVVPD